MSGAIGTWVDGVATGSIPADDRGLQYGDGVFETLLIRRGTVRFIDLHLARLARGLTRLGIAPVPEDQLRRDISHALALAPDPAVLKLVVTRGSATQRGYAPPRDARPRRIVWLWPAAPMQGVDQGVSLRIARLRVADPAPLAGLKHLNRLENVLAAAEAEAEAAGEPVFDSLLLDSHGNLVSGTACNLFLLRAATLLTPSVDRAGVAGILRQVVLREAPRLGLEARECRLTLDDLQGANGLFVTNARIGVVPVARVGEHSFAMNDSVTRLARHIEALDA